MFLFSILISAALFIATLPLKTVQLAVKAKMKVDDRATGVRSLRSRLFRRREKPDDKNTSVRKNIRLFGKVNHAANKVAIASLRMACLFMKFLALVVTAVGAVLSVISLVFFSAIASAAGGIILLMYLTDGWSTGYTVGTTGVSGIIGDDYIPMGTSDGTVATAVYELGQYFIDSVGDYHSPPDHEVWREIPQINNKTIRCDCTGFAQAVIQYTLDPTCTTVDVPSMNSTSMIGCEGTMPDGSSGENRSWEERKQRPIPQFMVSHGFEYHQIVEENITPDMLQAGDILVSLHTGHAEFILGPNERFGWGAVQTQIPKTSTPYKRDDGTIGLYNNDAHYYVVLYRYVRNAEE